MKEVNRNHVGQSVIPISHKLSLDKSEMPYKTPKNQNNKSAAATKSPAPLQVSISYFILE